MSGSSSFYRKLSLGSDSALKKADLPMYKDKSFYPKSHRRLTKKQLIGRVVLGLAGVFLIYSTYLHLYGSSHQSYSVWEERQQAVKQAMHDSWAGYTKHAWGYDEFHVMSGKGQNMKKTGEKEPMGWIIVDTLDTLAIMGMTKELTQARAWVQDVLTYDIDYEVNTFETTIRMLGGLLSIYYLTKDDMYLDKAVDLGNRLYGAFKSPSGIPYASVNLHNGQFKVSHTDGGASSTAEVSTLQLEFKYLAKMTGETLFWEAAEHVMKVLDDNHPSHGLVPIFVEPETGHYRGQLIRLGSRGDSYYEYLLKQYLQTNETIYLNMYNEAVQGIKDRLVAKSEPDKLTYIGELDHGADGGLSPKMDHLVCFAGGMFALGATEGLTVDEARKLPWWSKTREDDLNLGMEITRTCWEMYARTKTGLAPEIVVFNEDPAKSADFIIKSADTHNLQRPETVESLFVLWRITKNPIYREWGWKIFESFQKYTKVENGYTSLDDVTKIPPPKRDNMESFWLAETLKYLYLLFDDSEEEILPLTDVVFNTEAHPFPKFEMGTLFETGWKRTKSFTWAV